MVRAVLLPLASVAAVFGGVLFAHAPAWSGLQLLGAGLLGVALPRLAGVAGTASALLAVLAFRATDTRSDGAFESVLLPSAALVLTAVAFGLTVARTPGLWKRVHHGWMGPGY